MFDFRLQVFHTVARRLNFTKAAEELFITQPAVSKHIQELEQHFKVKLFERNGTKIRLTTAGDILLQHTGRLLNVYHSLELDMNSLAQPHSGKIRIGASTTVAQYVLPGVLAAFHRRFTGSSIELTVNNTEQIEHLLQQQKNDLGIIEGRSRNALFKYTPFVKDELVLVAASNHPLARKGVIKPEELLQIPLLMREPGSGTLEVLAHALKPLGIKISQLKKEMQLESTESAKQYVLHSDCMAFLSVHSVLKELQNKECAVIEVKGLTIERDFYFIRPHGQTESLPELFMNFALRYNFRL